MLNIFHVRVNVKRSLFRFVSFFKPFSKVNRATQNDVLRLCNFCYLFNCLFFIFLIRKLINWHNITYSFLSVIYLLDNGVSGAIKVTFADSVYSN